MDGFAKFVSGNKLVTMNDADLLYWGASQTDINTLYAATNAANVVYTKVYLPLTQNDVSKTNGQNLGYKGSYINYYVANNRVLVPNYNDPNDAVANAIIAGLYPGRTVVGIDVRNLYGNGGMVHCVTQQQPLASVLGINTFELNKPKSILYPNPAKRNIALQTKETIIAVTVYNEIGQKMNIIILENNKLVVEPLSSGTYFIKIVYTNNQTETLKFVKE
nr:agmatine deiminase family protein [Flavobacterium sp.]